MAGIRSLARCAAHSLLALLALLCAVACSTKLPEPVTSQRLIESPATVTAIDLPARRLAVTTADGTRSDVMLDPTVKNIDRIEVGDRVVVSYYQGVAAEVKKPGNGPGEPRASGAAPSPGAQVRTTVNVVAIDTRANTITVRSPDGRTRTLSVVREEGQRFIRGLRAGDEVEIAFTEAVAVGVRPAQ